MISTTTSLESEHFNICWGRIEPNSEFQLVYRNIEDPAALDGQVTHWIYGIEGDGYAIISGQNSKEEFYIKTGELIKVPEFYNKKVTFKNLGGGAIWVSFNPKPHTDKWNAEQINISPGAEIAVDAVDYDRYLVLLTGHAIIRTKEKTADLTRTVTIKLSAGKSIKLSSMLPSVVGIFHKEQ